MNSGLFWPVPGSSSLFWPLLASSGASSVAGEALVSTHPRFARIPLRFDAPAAVSREFLPLLALFWGATWVAGGSSARGGAGLRFDAPALVSRYSAAFRRSSCGFARIPASSGLLWVLLGGHSSCGPQRRTRCGFARTPLRFASAGLFWGEPLRLRAATAHAARREFRCVSTLPLWFHANSGLLWPVLASSFGLFWPSSLFGVYAGIIFFCVRHLD